MTPKHASGAATIPAALAAALALAGLLVVSGVPSAMARTASAASGAPSVPPGAPMEDVRYAHEWPAPNGNLYNTRVAHTTISSANVSTLGVAWTLPLTGRGLVGLAGSNATLAIVGSTLLAGADVPLTKTQHPVVVAYRLGATGHLAPTPSGSGQGQAPGAARFLVANAAGPFAPVSPQGI